MTNCCADRSLQRHDEHVSTSVQRTARRSGYHWSAGRPGRGRTEGAEELVAEGAHGLEGSRVTRDQPTLPVPGGYLPEYRRIAGDDRDRHVVTGPGAGDGGAGLLVAEQDEHEVGIVE